MGVQYKCNELHNEGIDKNDSSCKEPVCSHAEICIRIVVAPRKRRSFLRSMWQGFLLWLLMWFLAALSGVMIYRAVLSMSNLISENKVQCMENRVQQ